MVWVILPLDHDGKSGEKIGEVPGPAENLVDVKVSTPVYQQGIEMWWWGV